MHRTAVNHMDGLSGTEPETGPTRILIVDAYSHSREGLRASLRGGGWSVETAATSWEAISKMKDGRFHVAVIDLELPPAHGVAMSGWDLARIFRALNPAVGLILVTAERSAEVKRQAERLGGSRLLEKPINPTELRVIVKALHPGPGAVGEPAVGEPMKHGGCT
jgi:CheY-like chemotaxis protein